MHLFGTSQLFGQALGVWRGTEGAPHHRVGQRGLGGEHAEKKKKKELTYWRDALQGLAPPTKRFTSVVGSDVSLQTTRGSPNPQGPQHATLVGNRVTADVIS